jgi:anti-sigma regulatory factor (Ser/Thr protein kinase)
VTQLGHAELRGDLDLAVLLSGLRGALREAGLPPVEVARLLTVSSELGRNMLKYAGGGWLWVEMSGSAPRWVEVRAEDHGPGIADVAAALTDRFSTGGTLGLGLPGVRRMMDQLDIQTPVGAGTGVRARRWLP